MNSMLNDYYFEAEQSLLKKIQGEKKLSLRLILAAIELNAISSSIR